MPSKDELIGLASIVVPPTDPLEKYLLDNENDLHMRERNEIDRILFEQQPLLILMRKRYILLLLVLTFQSMKKKDY